MTWINRALIIGLGTAMLPTSGQAATAEEFYKSKPEMRMIVSSTAGGGYDFFGRLVAKYLSKHLPGNPTVVVQNMPGAGGIVATNYLYNVAPKDGTTLGIIDRGVATAEVLYGKTSGGKFDATKFNWIGSMAKEVGVGLLSTKAPIKTLEEAKAKEVVVGSNGFETDPAMYARLFNKLIGTKFKVVVGYPGQTEYLAAMEKGETDATFMSGWSGPNSIRAKAAFGRGDLKYIVQMTSKRHPDFGDVPTIYDVVKDEKDRKVVDILLSRLELGRPFVMPPGVAGDRVAVLREAFKKAAADPELLKEAPRGANSIDPVFGEEAQKKIEAIYQTPPELLTRLREIVQFKQ